MGSTAFIAAASTLSTTVAAVALSVAVAAVAVAAHTLPRRACFTPR